MVGYVSFVILSRRGFVSVVFWVMCEFLCHCTLLFWLSLQGHCEGPKRVLFFSLAWVDHMDSTQETNFCFNLVCKVVAKVQRSSISLFFSCTCVCHMYRKLRLFYGLLILSNFFTNLFYYFFFFFVLWRENRVACLVKIKLVFWMEIYKQFQFFHLD